MRLSAVHSTSVARTVSLDIKEHSGRSAMGVTSTDRRNGTVGDGRVMLDRTRPQSSPLQKRRHASAASRQHPKTETDHAQPVRRAQPIRRQQQQQRQRQRQRNHGGARDGISRQHKATFSHWRNLPRRKRRLTSTRMRDACARCATVLRRGSPTNAVRLR